MKLGCYKLFSFCTCNPILVLSHLQIHPLTTHADAVELAILILVYFYTKSHTLCMQAAKDLSPLHMYTSMHVPSCLDTGMSASTKIKCSGSSYMFSVLQVLIYVDCF